MCSYKLLLDAPLNVTVSESGDLSCPLYELRLALEQLVGSDVWQLVLQDIYIEIDALTEKVK